MIELRPNEVVALRVLAGDARWLSSAGWRGVGMVNPGLVLKILVSLGLAEKTPGWPARVRVSAEGLAWLREAGE